MSIERREEKREEREEKKKEEEREEKKEEEREEKKEEEREEKKGEEREKKEGRREDLNSDGFLSVSVFLIFAHFFSFFFFGIEMKSLSICSCC